jgi:hypothetical protein
MYRNRARKAAFLFALFLPCGRAIGPEPAWNEQRLEHPRFRCHPNTKTLVVQVDGKVLGTEAGRGKRRVALLEAHDACRAPLAGAARYATVGSPPMTDACRHSSSTP